MILTDLLPPADFASHVTGTLLEALILPGYHIGHNKHAVPAGCFAVRTSQHRTGNATLPLYLVRICSQWAALRRNAVQAYTSLWLQTR